MNNGKRAAIAAVCLGVLVGGGYLLFRWRENNGHHPAYGDVATWLTFLAAAIGIPFAAYQFVLQRRQLADQQKAINEEFTRQRKRDELLDGQLHQVRAANRVLVRQQAEKVDLRFESWSSVVAHDAQGQTIRSEARHFARVANRSTRPIRHVSCSIADDVTGESEPAVEVGRYDLRAALDGDPMIPKRGTSVAVIRAGQEYGFVFGRLYSDLPVRVAVTFTDDADVRWRIDHDLHLEQID